MKLWMKLHIGGELWRVYLVSPKSKHLIDSKDERCAGRTWVDTCRIFIANDLGTQARESTLIHELLHALVYVSGGFSAIQRACAAQPTDDELVVQGVEDDIVHPMAPLLHRLIKDLGFQLQRGD